MVKIKYIIKAIEDYTEKCDRGGPKPTSGLQTPPPTFSQAGEKLTKDELHEIAKVSAERWGLEISVDENGKEEISRSNFKLWDPQNNTVISLGKVIKNNNSTIDFTNTDKGVYNLDYVLQSYNEMPDLMKRNCEYVEFNNNGRNAMRQSSYMRTYEPDKGFNTVTITGMVFNNKDTQFNLKQVLGHEMGHASESHFTAEEKRVLAKAWVKNTPSYTYWNSRALTDEERVTYNGAKSKMDMYSSSPIYRDAQSKNKEKYASEYVYRVNYLQTNSEDWAETMSAVAYRNSADKSSFKMVYQNGKVVDWDTFVADHKGTYDFCCDYVDGKIKTP